MAVLKIKDALGNVYNIPSMQGVGVASLFVVEDSGNYKLAYKMTDGSTGIAGALPSATPVGTHTHVDLTYDGKIGSTAGLLVETTTDGAVTATRKIVSGTTPPDEVTGLNAGDIYLYYSA